MSWARKVFRTPTDEELSGAAKYHPLHPRFKILKKASRQKLYTRNMVRASMPLVSDAQSITSIADAHKYNYQRRRIRKLWAMRWTAPPVKQRSRRKRYGRPVGRKEKRRPM